MEWLWNFPIMRSYISLTNLSFLRGASHPEELVDRAGELGYTALAITDECSLAGVVRAHVKAKRIDLPLIIGSEFRLSCGLKLVLLATDCASYGRLSNLITCARRNADKGAYFLDRGLLETNCPSGCLALWLPAAKPQAADGKWLLELFPGQTWIAFEHVLEGNEPERLWSCRP